MKMANLKDESKLFRDPEWKVSRSKFMLRPTIWEPLDLGFSFAETFRSFFAETFLSLKRFDHLSNSCIKTPHNSVH